MTLLASCTTIIATIVCCLTIAIQNSFHKLLYDQLKASYADAIITPKYGHYFLNKHTDYLDSLHHLNAWAPSCWKYGLVAHNNPFFCDTETRLATIKFVDPHKEHHFFLRHTILKNSNGVHPLSNGIIIGSTLQARLGVTLGESIHLILLQKNNRGKKRRIKPAIHSVTVNGIITTGTPEIDETLIICSYDLGKKFIPELKFDEITVLTAQDQNNQCDIIKTIQEQFPELLVRSYKELHPTFSAAIALERYVTWLYLVLLFLFVAITHIALFLMQAIHNQSKIIILHLLGIRKRTLYYFTFFSFFAQTIIATGIGICLARAIAYWITAHTPQEIQRAYHICHLPIEFSVSLIATVIAIMASMTIITGCFMFILLSQYNTMHTLRNET